jgi:hypothetical protein
MATTATEIWNGRNDIIAYEWSLEDGETGDAAFVPNRSDKSIQVSGTFGAGGDIRVEGSVDPDKVVFSPLTDPQGNTVALTAAGIETILENVAYIRPTVSAGTGVSVTVRIFMAGS